MPMIDNRILKLYSRKDIQQAIVDLAKQREMAVHYANGSFGKRPDVLLYPNDVLELAKEEATSFHLSEERWKDPLQLKTGMYKKQLDELRLAWDLVLDIDTNYLEFAKATAELLVKAIHFYDITSFGIKFSGRSGFHILVPFESFPATVNEQETKFLFPDGVRNIAQHLKELIREPLREQILTLSTLEEIQKSTGKTSKELLEKNQFNPFTVVDIDSVLISSRHMFRSVYSLNEKSGLVSIPILPNQVKNFKLRQAKIENVTTDIPFLVKPKEPEATHLIIEAFDRATKAKHSYLPPAKETQGTQTTTYEIPKIKVQEEFFPECMKKTLQGMESDGRKRAVFVLINFLRHMAYSFDEVLERLLEWNQKNYEPLREGYIRSQVSWAKRQKETVLPPNCSNKAYYPLVGSCTNCKAKNAVQYVKRRLKMKAQEKKPRKRISKKQTKKVMKTT